MTEDQNKEFGEGDQDLNNFAFKLPDDHYEPIPGNPKIRSGYSREQTYENGCLDQKIRENTTNLKHHSVLFLNQTYRDFFLKIDELIAELGLEGQIDAATQKIWAPDRV